MKKNAAVVEESASTTDTNETDTGSVDAAPKEMTDKQVDAMSQIAIRTKTSTDKQGNPDPAHYQAIGTVLTLVMLLPSGVEKVVRWTYGKWYGITGKGSRPYCLTVVSEKALKNGANFSMTEILGDIRGLAQIGYKSYHKMRGNIINKDGNAALSSLFERAFKPAAKVRDIIEQNGARYGYITWSRKDDGNAGRYPAFNKKCTPEIPDNMVAFDNLTFDATMLKASAPEWMKECETWGAFFGAIDDNRSIGRYRLDGGSDDDDNLDGLY